MLQPQGWQSTRWQRGLAWAGAACAAGVLSGCVVAPIDDMGYAYSTTTVYSSYGHPPPLRVEYRSVAPSPYHIWQAGQWVWLGSRYDWQPGYWVAPSRAYRPAPRPMPPRYGPPSAPRPAMRPPAPRPPSPQVRPPQRPQENDSGPWLGRPPRH